MKDGNEIITVDNGIVVNEIEKCFLREFFCYSYNKNVKTAEQVLV